MSLLTRGTFIWYKPTRYVFALSSGSWTGRPANKDRPCLVIESTQRTTRIVPLVGAVETGYGQWVQPSRMVAKWWHPVVLNPRYPAPNDNMNRNPLTLDYTRYPSLQYTPKPSYIWSGDMGEVVGNEVARYANLVSPSLTISEAELQELLAIIEAGKEWAPIE